MIVSRKFIERYFFVVSLFSATSVCALPFNQEMVGVQPGHGDIMRQQPKDSVPKGASERYTGTQEDALKETNPVSADIRSLSNGRRLYAANCSSCHGKYMDEKYIPGAVQNQVPAPNLNLPFYKDKADGNYFKYIHFGGPIMPAYGFKFSIRDHWDIINYVRHMQNKVKP